MVWNPLNIFRSRREKARKIEEEVEALRRMGTYKERPRGELLEEVKRRKAGREFAGKVEEEARRMPLALPAPRGRERAENILNRFREGRISDTETESEILDLARNGLITETDAQYAIMLIPKIRGIRDRPSGLVRTGRFLKQSPGYAQERYEDVKRIAAGAGEAWESQSTNQGGMLPTLRQIRSPLYGKVQSTFTPPGKLDPEVRSAINKARLRLQKDAKEEWRILNSSESIVEHQIESKEREIQEREKALTQNKQKMNEEVTKRNVQGDQQGGGGPPGGMNS